MESFEFVKQKNECKMRMNVACDTLNERQRMKKGKPSKTVKI